MTRIERNYNATEFAAFIEQCRHRGETLQNLEGSISQAEQRAKLFRDSIVDMVPEFSCGGTCAGRRGNVAVPHKDELNAHTGAETQAAHTAGIQPYQGNSEPTADDGDEGWIVDELLRAEEMQSRHGDRE